MLFHLIRLSLWTKTYKNDAIPVLKKRSTELLQTKKLTKVPSTWVAVRFFPLPRPPSLTVCSARPTQNTKVLRTLWRWYCDSSGTNSIRPGVGGLFQPMGHLVVRTYVKETPPLRKTKRRSVGGSQIIYTLNYFGTKTPRSVVLDIIFSGVIRRDGLRLWGRRVHLNTARHWALPGICLSEPSWNTTWITSFCLSTYRWFLPDEVPSFWITKRALFFSPKNCSIFASLGLRFFFRPPRSDRRKAWQVPKLTFLEVSNGWLDDWSMVV